MDKIWAAVAGFAIVLLGVLGIHRAGKTSAKNEVAAKSADKAMKTQGEAREAERAGQKRHEEIADADIDPNHRDVFK